jgi:hypothetical protein
MQRTVEKIIKTSLPLSAFGGSGTPCLRQAGLQRETSYQFYFLKNT